MGRGRFQFRLFFEVHLGETQISRLQRRAFLLHRWTYVEYDSAFHNFLVRDIHLVQV